MLGNLEASISCYTFQMQADLLERKMAEIFAKDGFKPDQPRIPRGQTGGGQWTGGGSGTSRTAPHGWGNPAKLDTHVKSHGKDFGISSAEEYAKRARQFFRRAQQGKFPAVIDNKGILRAYDPKTNIFGSYNADGTTRTFYKPTGGAKYFERQIEKYSGNGGRVVKPVASTPSHGGGRPLGGGLGLGGVRIDTLKPKIN